MRGEVGIMDNKLLTTWEMVKAMAENPKRKATKENNSGIVMFIHGTLCWDDGNPFMFHLKNDIRWDTLHCDKWEIIEPQRKLKEMSLGEVIHIWSSTTTRADKCVSIVTNMSLDRSWKDISKNELIGLWTVEGVYEDEP